MKYVDSHCQLYLAEFNGDLQSVIESSCNAGVTRILLPNIDISSWQLMLDLCQQFPQNYFAMDGLHPTLVLTKLHSALLNLMSVFCMD
jgi:TatD DNase family protein